MVKRNIERNYCKNSNFKKISDNKGVSIINENVLEKSNVVLLKSESALSLLENNFECRIPNKKSKMANDTDEIIAFDSLRLSHYVIVNSVLKETKIDPNIEALLPQSLDSIYQKFKSSKKYIDNFQAKEEFYCGVGLFGIGIEERIYNKRKALEESLIRGIRLRANPKPRRQFDGTVINRSLKNSKIKYNVFNIGADPLKRSQRRQIRKPIKKKTIVKRPSAQKLVPIKKTASESQGSSDESDIHPRSIALSRTKRQPKVPQLGFKYCYNVSGVVRTKKSPDCEKEDEFMEIDDSDSSSVVEVCPPPAAGDKENNNNSENNGLVQKNVPVSTRKSWPAKENKALNILDKLRLGLQCTILQNEDEIIIQHLTVEDLNTLRRRLQGLASFKNIEAEYDKNGEETARVTIDRRMLNLPGKSGNDAGDCRVVGVDQVKRRTQTEERQRHQERPVDEYCPSWVRPKVRSVKKVRKLYTQGSSTPNILARSQSQNRPTETTSWSSSGGKCLSSAGDSNQGTTMSFYPQLSSVMTEPIVVDNVIKTEPRLGPVPVVEDVQPVSVTSESSVPVPAVVAASPVCATVTGGTMTDVSRPRTSHGGHSTMATGTPATAMSASQLLMLRKGAAAAPPLSTGGASSDQSGPTFPDQLFPNQILGPYKRPITACSPPKLELDDEEADFELSPSLIAQAKSGRGPVLMTTTRLMTAAGPRRTIHVPGTATFRPILPHPPVKAPPPSMTTVVPATVTVGTALTTQSPGMLVSGGSGGSPAATMTIKHRKWTHNFLTSNNINFREVLCAPSSSSSSAAVATRPLAHIQPHTVTTITDHRPPPVPPPQQSLTMTAKSSPSKGSSVVLKSLLVGSNVAAASTTCSHSLDLISNSSASKSVIWAPKYLAQNCPGHDSKIKWQLGGSLLPAIHGPQSALVVAKENKSLDLANDVRK